MNFSDFYDDLNAGSDIPEDQALLKKAQAIGISKSVLDEAKKELNVRSLKEGSQWYWEIPEKTE